MKMKKILTCLVVLCMAMFLSACSISVTTKGLNNYFLLEGSTGVSQTMQDMAGKNREYISAVMSLYTGLGLSYNDKADLDLLCEAMTQWSDAIPSTILVDSTNKEYKANGFATPQGQIIFDAMQLNDDYRKVLIGYTMSAIYLDVQNTIYDLYKVTDLSQPTEFSPRTANLYFSNNKNATGIYSDVDVACTLLGLNIDSVTVYIYKEGTSYTSGKSYNLSVSNTWNQDLGLYNFAFSGKGVLDGCTAAVETYDGYVGSGDKWNIKFLAPNSDSYSASAWKTGGSQTTRAYDLCKAGCFVKKYALEGDTWFFVPDGNCDETDSKEKYTVVADIGYICGANYTYETKDGKQVISGVEKDESKTKYYVKVKVNASHLVDDSHIDISTWANTSSAAPIPLFPTDKKMLKGDCKEVAGYKMTDILEAMKAKTTGNVVVLKKGVDLGVNTKIDVPTSTKYDILSKDGLYEKLKYNGSDVKIAILDNVKETKDMYETVKYNLNIGKTTIGTMSFLRLKAALGGSTEIQTIVDGIAQSDASNLMHLYKIYDNGANNVNILYCNYDVGILHDIDVTYDEGSDTYTVKRSLMNEQLVYNILDNQLYRIASKANAKQPSQFDKTANVYLYSGADVITSNLPDNVNCTAAASKSLIEGNTTNLNNFRSALQKRESPFVLRTYMEGLYLPAKYQNEDFFCLGRKVIFTTSFFDKDMIITPDVPIYDVVDPLKGSAAAGAKYAYTYLVSSTKRNKEVNGTIVPGIARLIYKDAYDIVRLDNTGQTISTTNSLYFNKIYVGKFRTYNGDKISCAGQSCRSYHGNFANGENGPTSPNTPELFVWCTLAKVDNSLYDYINSNEFSSWVEWLNKNGYPGYAGTDVQNLTEGIVDILNVTYNISLGGSNDKDKTVVISEEDLNKMQETLNATNNSKVNAVFNVVFMIIGAILLFYGILMIFCYVIDVAAAGEGKGFLNKITFDRMQSVTGMSREERKQMSEKGEKGTYTTRAVAIQELIPVVLIIWIMAVLLLFGRAYNIVDKLINMANDITRVIREAIGKVE